jgi:hypothetical protein
MRDRQRAVAGEGRCIHASVHIPKHVHMMYYYLCQYVCMACLWLYFFFGGGGGVCLVNRTDRPHRPHHHLLTLHHHQKHRAGLGGRVGIVTTCRIAGAWNIWGVEEVGELRPDAHGWPRLTTGSQGFHLWGVLRLIQGSEADARHRRLPLIGLSGAWRGAWSRRAPCWGRQDGGYPCAVLQDQGSSRNTRTHSST